MLDHPKQVEAPGHLPVTSSSTGPQVMEPESRLSQGGSCGKLTTPQCKSTSSPGIWPHRCRASTARARSAAHCQAIYLGDNHQAHARLDTVSPSCHA